MMSIPVLEQTKKAERAKLELQAKDEEIAKLEELMYGNGDYGGGPGDSLAIVQCRNESDLPKKYAYWWL